MILKMMKNDGLEDSNPSKTCVVYSNVVGVDFRRTLLAGKGILAVGFNTLTENDIVKYTMGSNTTVGYDTFIELPMEGNAYLMNDEGKTFQVFSPDLPPDLPDEPIEPKKEKKPAVKRTYNKSPKPTAAANKNFQPHGQNFQPYGQNIQPYGQNIQPHGQNFQPYGQNIQPYGQNVHLGLGSVHGSGYITDRPITMEMMRSWNLLSRSIVWSHIFNFKGYTSDSDIAVASDKSAILNTLEELNHFLILALDSYSIVSVYDGLGRLVLHTENGEVFKLVPNMPEIVHAGLKWNSEKRVFE